MAERSCLTGTQLKSVSIRKKRIFQRNRRSFRNPEGVVEQEQKKKCWSEGYWHTKKTESPTLAQATAPRHGEGKQTFAQEDKGGPLVKKSKRPTSGKEHRLSVFPVQDFQPGNGTAHRDLEPPTSVIHQIMLHIFAHKLCFPDDSNFCQGDIKLATTRDFYWFLNGGFYKVGKKVMVKSVSWGKKKPKAWRKKKKERRKGGRGISREENNISVSCLCPCWDFCNIILLQRSSK